MRRVDGYMNFATGLGAALGYDKVAGAVFRRAADKQPEYYEALYEDDALAKRIVNRPIFDALRKGFELKSSADFDKAAVAKAWESIPVASPMPEVGLDVAFARTMAMAQATGGAALVLGIDDRATDMAHPLNEKSIRSFQWTQPLSRSALSPVKWYDKGSNKFGQVELWRVHWPTSGGQQSLAELVHESRLVLFDGEWLSDRSRAARGGVWGGSIYRSLEDELKAQGLTWAAMSTMIQDTSQAVMKIKNLHDIVASESDGDEVIQKRLRIIDYCRSVARAIAVDADTESFEYQNRQLSGVDAIGYALMYWLSAQVDIPVALLFSFRPGGLQNNGDTDIRQYYDRIAGYQKTYLKHRQVRVLRLVTLAKEGPTRGKEPAELDIKHNPLWEMDDTQKADVRLKVAQADQIYHEIGWVLPEEGSIARFGGEAYSMETTIDVDLRSSEDFNKPAEPPPVEPPTQDPSKEPGAANETPPPKEE